MSDTPRRIPRPWLKRESSMSFDRHVIDIIEPPPRWTISWKNLSSFCCPPEEEPEHAKDLDHTDDSLIAKRTSFDSGLSQPSRGHHPHEYDSFSEFTVSDSSSSSRDESSSGDEGSASFLSREEGSSNPMSGAKPNVFQSQSSLPPRIRRSMVSVDQKEVPRNRCDTGDYSRNSGTTNASRHRREQQFEFSVRSLEEIHKGTSRELQPPPMLVLCQDGVDGNSRRRMSDLDDDKFWSDLESSTSSFVSPIPQAQQQSGRNGKGKKKTPKTQRLPPIDRRQQRPPEIIDQGAPSYLRIDHRLNAMPHRGRLILSGWIAASFGPIDLASRLRAKSRLSIGDLYYMQMLEVNNILSLRFLASDGTVLHTINPRRGWRCEIREINSRVGMSVVVQDESSQVVSSLLPVDVCDHFFSSSGGLVAPSQFSRIRHLLFAQGDGKVYAPYEQNNAAMFVMFSFDSIVRTYVA